MAPFDQFPQLLFPAFRPVHVTLTEPHPGLRSIVRTIEDPYFHNTYHHHHHEVVFSPSFDVRESESAFFLEGEFPGVGKKEDITIEKLGPRTLLVESNMARFDLDAEWGQHAIVPLGATQNAKADQQRHQYNENRGEKQERGEEGKVRQVNPWSELQGVKGNAVGLQARLAERHVGYLQRSFTFPCSVDIDALKARLRCGLLVMMIPKTKGGNSDSKMISIED
jgi:HSP20 family molecular chaperone IbpA